MSQAQPYRLPATARERIDRRRVLTFKFDGKSYTGFAGDTLASALAANGVRIVARSFKYHRPRGLYSDGHSMNALVQIGAQVSESVWHTPLSDGLEAQPVNAWPSLRRDVLRVNQLAGRFLPVGFYYKTFIRPQRLWPTYERLLRQAGGLGRVDINAPRATGFDKQVVHADVVVVGGGPAGHSAAITAAGAGARVLLLEADDALGGHLQYAGATDSPPLPPAQRSPALPGLTIMTGATALGWYDGQWLAAEHGQTLLKIRTAATVFATGAEAQPHLFDNNDLPGVMLGPAAARLLHLYAVAPGRRVVVVTANDDGWRLAGELAEAGITVVAVADHRARGGSVADTVAHSGVPAYWQHTVVAARGARAVEAADIAPTGDTRRAQSFACDAIIVTTGWAPRHDLPTLAGVRFAYDDRRREFLPVEIPEGIYLAGRVTGSHDAMLAIDEGAIAGRDAAAFAGYGTPAPPQQRAALTRRRNGEPVRTSAVYRVAGEPHAKRFVDLDEDVTDKDITDAIAEGYNSIELLKRYSTVGMGPSQGRWSNMLAIRLAADANGWTINQTGKTTSRPPIRPVKLAQLAGPPLDPVRVTPLHAWHLAQGAAMMVAGQWLRPLHYGRPDSEVRAVRERVGLIDVSTLGKIKLTGAGVPALLDRLYTGRFSNLQPGRVRYGLMCTSEGVVFDDGVTARVAEDEWYMTTTSGGAGAVFEWIQWWIQSGWGEDVHVTSVSEAMAALNLAGPRARDVLSRLTSADISADALPYMRTRVIDIAGVPCRVLRIGFTGELSFELHVPASYARGVWEAVIDAGADFGLAPFGVEAQRVLRLEKGHIIVGQDTDALSDPLSADLGWAVKLAKDDFLGQRALIRRADQGVRQQLVGFKMEDHTIVPEEGLQIVRPVAVSERHPLGLEIIGWVTSCRHSPTLGQTIGLCWLPATLAEIEGARFAIRREDALVYARVFHGPFYDPDGARLRA